jgi:GNAT superfamily N-acetyltransferase
MTSGSAIRIATVTDIPQIQVVRNSVKENMLPDPALVSDEDCVNFLTVRGKGWVYEENEKILGFAIVDMQDHNIWALFVHPDFEKKGIGSALHDMMLNWYFSQTDTTVWLGTDPATRAFRFYEAKGWIPDGKHGELEAKFIMPKNRWSQIAADQ